MTPDLERIEALEAEVKRLNMELEPKLEYMNFQNGKAEAMLTVAKGFMATLCHSFAELNKDAENYTEQEVEILSTGKRYTVTVRNGGKPTPHELRQKAEAERDAFVARVRELEKVEKAAQFLHDCADRYYGTDGETALYHVSPQSMSQLKSALDGAKGGRGEK